MKYWIALFVAIVTIQCISAEETKLYVVNLSYMSNEDGLRQLFENVGTVLDVVILRDRDTGRSRGFGFVTMCTEEEAEAAITQLNGNDLDGRRIRVTRASDRKDNTDDVLLHKNTFEGSFISPIRT